ncbi:YdcF family protein [Thioalkalivibrio sp. ALgr3]|uniref:YdcF family protein n=1 Tax=Thioalkalivibrio sp. ALgr3 TaxID=1239292 RepID=UPI000363C405|nr:YdcF family protein [Thioalkalivibrio sp. ALgr3]
MPIILILIMEVTLAQHRRVTLGRVGADGLAMFALSQVVILATLGVSLLLAWHGVRRTAHAPCRPRAVETVLVAGMQLEEGHPTPGYRLRLLRALRLLRRHPQARVLLLGGQTAAQGPSEAAAGAAFLRERGVANARIRIEDRSTHTLENLRHARDLMREESAGSDDPPAVLVTSRYHLARALAIARGLGLHLQPCPAEPGRHAARGAVLWREAWLLHWYHTGRVFARVFRRRGMLRRIT